jgi:tetratricopeptide (TPR) repeat protein
MARTTAWLACVLALLAGTAVFAQAPASTEAGTGAAAAPGTPTVSPDEYTLLEEVRRVGDSDPAQAVARLRAVITPSSSAVLLDALGVYCQQKGDLDQAATAFQDAVRRAPGYRRARENLAKVWLQQEKYDDALAAIADLEKQGASDLAWAQAARARVLLHQGRFEDAGKALAALLERDLPAASAAGVPGKAELWRLLGQAWLHAGHPAAAETAFRNALVYRPSDRGLRTELIQSVVQQHGPIAARPLVRREVEADPLRGELWRLLASADWEAGKTGEALVHLECAHRLGLAGKRDLADLGDLLFDQGLTAEAMERYLQAAALEDPPVPRLLRAAEGFASLGKPDEAERLLRRLEERKLPLSAAEMRKTTAARAQVAEARGDPDAALKLYRTLLADNPLDADALMKSARILQQQGELEDALLYYERATRADAAHRPASLVYQAQIAVEREDYRRAAELLEQSLALKRDPALERYLEQVRQVLR